MKPSNFIQFICILLCIAFTITEYQTEVEVLDEGKKDLRVALSYAQHNAAKMPKDSILRSEIKRMKTELQDYPLKYSEPKTSMLYKLLFIFIIGGISLYQLSRYFKISFDDEEEQLIASQYMRTNWLIAYLHLVTVALWLGIIKEQFGASALFYFLSIGCTVYALILSNKIGKMAKDKVTWRFKITNVLAGSILYFNLLILAILQIYAIVEKKNLLTVLISIIKEEI